MFPIRRCCVCAALIVLLASGLAVADEIEYQALGSGVGRGYIPGYVVGDPNANARVYDGKAKYFHENGQAMDIKTFQRIRANGGRLRVVYSTKAAVGHEYWATEVHCIPVNGAAPVWTRLPGSAQRIDVGADGSVWVIGTVNAPLGGQKIYKWNGKDWVEVDGGGSEIALGPDGVPWVANDKQEIYRRVGNQWEKLPGSAFDIDIGADGSAWIVGTKYSPMGLGVGNAIYKWNGQDWDEVDGEASQIAVGPDGVPWVTNLKGEIYRRTGNQWERLPGKALPDKALDIDIGKDGSVWVVGTELAEVGGYVIYKWNGQGWDVGDGGGMRIAVDPHGKPWVRSAHPDDGVYRRK